MIWTRLRDHRTDRRIAAIDGFQFPTGVRQRLGHQHHDLGSDDIRMVEAATRQWFRLIARHPRAKLSMPSVIVGNLWHELASHTRDYAAFCDAAFGRLLRDEPDPAKGVDNAHADRLTLLRATLSLARQDEGCGPSDLPLLFRVDRDLHIDGGTRYLADCGGRGQCFHTAGVVCLQHLGGPGKRPGPRGIRGNEPPDKVALLSNRGDLSFTPGKPDIGSIAGM